MYTTLHGSLQQVLVQRLGWTSLREVQEEACKAVQGGRDVLIIAPTAGGKTEAALIPVIDSILKHGGPGVSCLYISPLKALINDQEERFATFCTTTGLDLMKWHGDVPKGDRSWKSAEPPQILMITPESLEVLLLEPALSADLVHLRFIIIDEVHAFVESERGIQLRTLLDRLDLLSGRPVQRIGLSATVGNPSEVLDWLSGGKTGSVLVQVPVEPREKWFSFIVENDEQERMAALVRLVRSRKAIIFVNSRSDAERAARVLKNEIMHLSVHHSSLSPELRKEAEDAFTKEGGACIISTSTLELGIDIGDLDMVVLLGPCASVSSFLQRMGRSGRRGCPPYVACVLENPCELLCMVAALECASMKRVEHSTPGTSPYNVLVQQILLELHRSGRTSARQLEQTLLVLAPFKKMPRDHFKAVIENLIRKGYLASDGDMLMPGIDAEKRFGRSNWRDVFSVISGGGDYRAVTPEGVVVGRLDARFVASSRSGNFPLGGKSWKMIGCDEAHNRVIVVPGSDQRSGVFWTGGQAGYTPLICRAVQSIISRGSCPLPLSPDVESMLAGVFSTLPAGIKEKGIMVWGRPAKRGKGSDVIVLTFQGRRFNQVLSVILHKELGAKKKVKYTDFSVIVNDLRGDDVEARVAALIRDACSWEIGDIGELLAPPPGGLWKFGDLVPEDLLRTMIWMDYYRLDEFLSRLRELDIETSQI
jgi:ATP-dependent Lhr-like helicase